MGSLGWVVLGVLIAPLAFFLLKIILGVVVSPKISGKAYLRQCALRLGVSPAVLTPALTTEIVEHAWDLAKIRVEVSGEGRRDAFVQIVEGFAARIAMVVHDERDGSSATEQVAKMMERHGVY